MAGRAVIASTATPATTVSGDSGNDRVLGGRGNDRLFGGSGNDRVDGGPGNDRITGGGGADRLLGRAGRDFIDARDGRIDPIGCGKGRDRVRADRFDIIGIDCERIVKPS